NKLKERYPQRNLEALGIDGSTVAIQQAAGRCKDIYWIADDVVQFAKTLKNENDNPESPWFQVSFDLIIDKTGITSIQDFNVALETMTALYGRLQKGGGYTYIASKKFYGVLKKRYIKNGWPIDKMSILDGLYDQRIGGDHKDPNGFYQRVYVKA
ncbi:MAG: hypothetical protein VYD19_08550, partial [Myxococcota bacterium]|nr:hypothetical protein [Myxococcota bacterium]